MYRINDGALSIDVAEYLHSPVNVGDTWSYVILQSDATALPSFLTYTTDTVTPVITFTCVSTLTSDCKLYEIWIKADLAAGEGWENDSVKFSLLVYEITEPIIAD